MKSLAQLFATTCSGFALGYVLMHDDEELMLIAGAIFAVMFFTTYLILFVGHMIYKRLNRDVLPDANDNDLPSSLLGFDSQGTLKIESIYPSK